MYLDGYKYHAAPGKNRIAEDADQRAGLRADGTVVFQFDWEAVSDMADDDDHRGHAVAAVPGQRAGAGQDGLPGGGR